MRTSQYLSIKDENVFTVYRPAQGQKAWSPARFNRNACAFQKLSKKHYDHNEEGNVINRSKFQK